MHPLLALLQFLLAIAVLIGIGIVFLVVMNGLGYVLDWCERHGRPIALALAALGIAIMVVLGDPWGYFGFLPLVLALLAWLSAPPR